METLSCTTQGVVTSFLSNTKEFTLRQSNRCYKLFN